MTSKAPDEAARTLVAEYYARYSEGLLSYIRAELPIAKVEAADVLHKVFQQVLEWCDKNPGRPIEYPRAFVYRIASRHLRKHADKTRRTASCTDTAVPTENVTLTSTERKDDVDYMARLSLASRNLLRSMRRLGDPSGSAPVVPELQRIVYLRFWVGMTESEIGEVLDLNRGTVSRRLRKARGELLVRLQQLEKEAPGSTKTSTTLLDRWWQRLEGDSQ